MGKSDLVPKTESQLPMGGSFRREKAEPVSHVQPLPDQLGRGQLHDLGSG